MSPERLFLPVEFSEEMYGPFFLSYLRRGQ